MHEHNDCNHTLKHCSHCDVVYCSKCKREWGQKETIYVDRWHSPNWYVWPTWIQTTPKWSDYQILCDGNASGSIPWSNVGNANTNDNYATATLADVPTTLTTCTHDLGDN